MTPAADAANHVRDVDDAYLSLKALAAYSGLSVRTLRGFIASSQQPLPHYRPGGKILVRRSEFDRWLSAFRSTRSGTDPHQKVNRVLEELCRDLRRPLTARQQRDENTRSAPPPTVEDLAGQHVRARP